MEQEAEIAARKFEARCLLETNRATQMWQVIAIFLAVCVMGLVR